MYLIKCKHCNELIEVKTEFLMLCPKCKNKIDNNFQEWHKQKENQEKNFTSYLNEVCISSDELEKRQKEEELEKLYNPEKNQRRKNVNLSAALLVLLVGIIFPTQMTNYLSEWWMEAVLIACNIGLGFIGVIWGVLMTLKRERFQSFTPLFIYTADILFLLLADFIFIIATNNI